MWRWFDLGLFQQLLMSFAHLVVYFLSVQQLKYNLQHQTMERKNIKFCLFQIHMARFTLKKEQLHMFQWNAPSNNLPYIKNDHFIHLFYFYLLSLNNSNTLDLIQQNELRHDDLHHRDEKLLKKSQRSIISLYTSAPFKMVGFHHHILLKKDEKPFNYLIGMEQYELVIKNISKKQLMIQAFHRHLQKKQYFHVEIGSKPLTCYFFLIVKAKALPQTILQSFKISKDENAKQIFINYEYLPLDIGFKQILQVGLTFKGVITKCQLQQYQRQKQTKTMNYTVDINTNTQDTHHTQLQETKPLLKEIVTIKALLNGKRSKVKISSFSWTKAQERKYISFLRANGRLFDMTVKERTDIKINVLMSCTIKSRTSSQCHSHHQKMLVKFGSIHSIIQNHAFLFTKENDSRKNKCQQMEPQKLSIQSLQRLQGEQDEPCWWRYLDLMQQDHVEPQCSQQYFFLNAS